MRKRGLVSAYTRKKFYPHTAKYNETAASNLPAGNFSDHVPGTCVVSDLTYVRVRDRWANICLLLDPGAREIIGYSDSSHKDAGLVRKAFSTAKGNLLNIRMFHTDRGSEDDKMLIDDLPAGFRISRSLSMKGCPYDNAVAESTFKMVKAEFVYLRCFETLEQLQAELSDYVHWFSNYRIHGTLGYLSPVEFKQTCSL
jgi:putative transposase